MNEAEKDMKNKADQGVCYNTLRDYGFPSLMKFPLPLTHPRPYPYLYPCFSNSRAKLAKQK